MLDCHECANSSVRTAAQDVGASTLDLAAAPLAVQVTKRRWPWDRRFRFAALAAPGSPR